MKFQKKILLLYAIFAFIMIMIMSGIYLINSIRNHNNKMENELQTVSDVKMQQLNTTFGNMESVTTYLLSSQDVLEAIKALSQKDARTVDSGEYYTEYYFKNEVKTIRTILKTYYMMKKFNNIVLFNKNGNVVSNDARQNITSAFSYSEYPWVEKIENTGGSSIIIGAHEDNWDTNGEQVISLIREIQIRNKGYVEVQITVDAIAELIQTEESEFDFLVMTTDGDLIYNSSQDIEFDIVKENLSFSSKSFQTLEDKTGKRRMLIEQCSAEQDLILVTVSRTDLTKSSLREVLPFMIALLLILCGASFIYIYYASVYLAKPIKVLQSFMENTKLENITDDIPEKISIHEIEALYLSYKDVLNRLAEAVVKEKRFSVLQLQAQFDLLQAQVNPHFIYNVLNVIADRGLAIDDEAICEMCSDLSEMLRYSTNTKEKFASIKEEVDYLNLYLTLLKFRYHEKLSYDIEISQEMYDEKLPKIILQQMVENSVLHGYQDSSDVIRIQISGDNNSDEWSLCVRDQGNGILQEKIEELYQEMQKVKEKLSSNRENVEMEIGGMGLVNIYARMYLLYADDLTFQLLSDSEQGTEVLIVVRR